MVQTALFTLTLRPPFAAHAAPTRGAHGAAWLAWSRLTASVATGGAAGTQPSSHTHAQPKQPQPQPTLSHPSLCPCLWLLQLACYDQGGRYTAHSDEDVAASPAGTSGVVARRYTAIYYPNDPSLPWEDHESSGGALRLWPKGSYEAISIPPVADRLVVFESHLTHEVQRVRLSGGRRCAFTAWYSAVG